MSICHCPTYDGWNYKGKKPPIPFPSLDSGEYKEGDVVYVYKNGSKHKGKVENIIISYRFYEPEKGWIYYYDIRWTGTGHTGGYYQFHEIEAE